MVIMINSLKKFKVFIIILTLSLIGFTTIAYGSILQGNGYKTVGENQIVEGDFILITSNGINNGNIVGDFIVLGKEAINNGLVEGDILSLTSQLATSGIVKGDIRGFASQASIAGEVNRNASVFANLLIFEEGSVIDGSIHALANTMKLLGFVGGDIRGAANSLEIEGTIKGNVYIYAKTIEFNNGARIEGDLIYYSEKNLNIPQEYVGGVIEHRYPSATSLPYQFNSLSQRIIRYRMLIKILFLLAYLMMGSVLIAVFKKAFLRAAAIIEEKFINSIGIGIGTLIAVPIVAILLIVTIIGIPIGIMLIALYVTLIYLSRIPVGIWLGQKIYKDSPHPIVSFIIGSVLLNAAALIPLFGWLISSISVVIGIGITLIMLKGYYKKEYEEIKE